MCGVRMEFFDCKYVAITTETIVFATRYVTVIK
jgi:hypothetical protein